MSGQLPVRAQRWLGLRNGVLLRTAVRSGFEVLVTADRSLEFQQNLPHFAIGVAVIITPDLRFRTIRPAIEAIREALISVSPGQVIRVPV